MNDSLRQRVFYAARDGMAITLFALLAEKTPVEIQNFLLAVTEDEGQRCTPLLIAARNGHHKVVHLLLSKFQPNLEQEGKVMFDGYAIEGASPLWAASAAGHFAVVKTLVRGGADVNHSTKTNSTPLRAACFDGRLDVVHFLAENGANIHMANKYNNTCLMIAAYKGYLGVVSYLLQKGADPNVKAHCGASALHFSAECGHDNVVRVLLEHGALLTTNEHGMTPLLAAAERARSGVVEYLISSPECTKNERIDGLELLGASFAHDKDNYSLEKCFFYLDWAMKERHSDPSALLPKPVVKPIPAYENHMECQDCEELESIRYDSNALHMEALVIRERILGSGNPEVPHPIIFRGAVFADSARFDRCLDLWMHALRLRQMNYIPVAKDLLRFAQVFSQMQHVGVEVPFQTLEEVLCRGAMELERSQARAASTLTNNSSNNCGSTSSYPSSSSSSTSSASQSRCSGMNSSTSGGTISTASSFAYGSNLSVASMSSVSVDEERDAALEELDTVVHTSLYLLVITTKQLKRCSTDQEMRVFRLVYRLVQSSPRTRKGQTLLHLASNPITMVDDFHTSDVCKFPCSATARLLIQCGADVNAADKDGNTPLHLIVQYQNPISDFLTLHSVIMALVEAGAHMDTVNRYGNTPFEAATSGVAEIILRTQITLSLQCLAAKAVRKFNLTYRGHVPHALESFIEQHGKPPGLS